MSQSDNYENLKKSNPDQLQNSISLFGPKVLSFYLISILYTSEIFSYFTQTNTGDYNSVHPNFFGEGNKPCSLIPISDVCLLSAYG